MARFEKKEVKKEIGKPRAKGNKKLIYLIASVASVIVVGASVWLTVYLVTNNTAKVDTKEKFPSAEVITASDLIAILDGETVSKVGDRFPSTFYVYIYEPNYDEFEICGRTDINKAVNDLIANDQEAYTKGLIEMYSFYVLNLNLGTNRTAGLEDVVSLDSLPVFLKIVGDELSERSVGNGVLTMIKDLNIELRKLIGD